MDDHRKNAYRYSPVLGHAGRSPDCVAPMVSRLACSQPLRLAMEVSLGTIRG